MYETCGHRHYNIRDVYFKSSVKGTSSVKTYSVCFSCLRKNLDVCIIIIQQAKNK